jgi:hypothetical protein
MADFQQKKEFQMFQLQKNIFKNSHKSQSLGFWRGGSRHKTRSTRLRSGGQLKLERQSTTGLTAWKLKPTNTRRLPSIPPLPPPPTFFFLSFWFPPSSSTERRKEKSRGEFTCGARRGKVGYISEYKEAKEKRKEEKSKKEKK